MEPGGDTRPDHLCHPDLCRAGIDDNVWVVGGVWAMSRREMVMTTLYIVGIIGGIILLSDAFLIGLVGGDIPPRPIEP